MASPSILVVNPNSTEAFTENIRSSLEQHAKSSADVDVDYLTCPPAGPPAINSTTTGVLSAAACLDRLLDRPCDGILVACFSSHPLVPMLRESLESRIPVVGIFEAALIHASMLGTSFGIVTTDARWQPLLTDDVRRFGFEHRCAGVLSGGLTVLEAESLPRDEVASRLAAKAKLLVDGRGADVIILGCAGFVGLQDKVRAVVGHGVPIVDGVTAGYEVLSGLIRTKQRTSSVGAYAPILR